MSPPKTQKPQRKNNWIVSMTGWRISMSIWMLFIRFFATLTCIANITHTLCGTDIWTKRYTSYPFLRFKVMILCVYATFHMFYFIIIFQLGKLCMWSYVYLFWTNHVAMHPNISLWYVINNSKCRYSQMKIFQNVSM